MAFAVHTRTQPGVTGRDPDILVLDDGAGGRAEVWPALGFNCFHWEAVRDGRALDLLYADPALFGDGRPTRSGVPVLFPFPNRIRDGRFSWDGREYRLPIDDPERKNAIHGFACHHPWRVVGQGADGASAWVTGEFQTGRDAPDCLPLWPADHLIRITYRLGAGRCAEAEVVNPDRRPLPFGLGYHPYFRVPFASGTAAACLVRVPARQAWTLVGSVPTGERRPIDPAHDLNAPRRFADVHADDLLTGVPSTPADAERTLRPWRRAMRRRDAAVAGVGGLPRGGGIHAGAPSGVLRRAVHLHHRRDQPPAARRGRRTPRAATRRPLVGGFRDATRTFGIPESDLMTRRKRGILPLSRRPVPEAVRARVHSPLAVVLGSPAEVIHLLHACPETEAVCYQMDLYQAEKLREALAEAKFAARVETPPDLWDLPADFQSAVYLPARGGERELKIDMVEQAFHVLRPGGALVVWSSYETDPFFPTLLKKVFGRVHENRTEPDTVFWCPRVGDRPRRRHEVTFQARVPDGPSCRFLSRPGVFSYGRFDLGRGRWRRRRP